jgi:hypothetical protein
MNYVTREIAEFLKVTLEVAAKVQYQLECEDFDFSECTTASLKRNVKRIFKEMSA